MPYKLYSRTLFVSFEVPSTSMTLHDVHAQDEKLSHIVLWSQLFNSIRLLELRSSLRPIGDRGSCFPLLRE